MSLRAIGFLLAACLWLEADAQEAGFATTVDEAFDKSAVIITASKHACYRFDVYLALTNDQRRRGLMFVRDMPMFTGMLFVYPQPRTLSIWMKNTYIPLDIVFFGQDGRIVNIHENAEPQTLNSRRSAEEVSYVLEINGGVSEALHIDTDSTIMLSL
jgi:uncharacterized membrane protein (UPF0127 family)